jgi:hypothetical protein
LVDLRENIDFLLSTLLGGETLLKKNNKIPTITAGLCFILICMILWTPQPVMADITWQDEFTNLNAWTIHTGDFDVIDGMAVATGTELLPGAEGIDPPRSSYMTRSSNVVMGNWSFDVRLDNNSHTAVLIMVHDAGPFSLNVSDSYPMMGIEFYQSQLILVRYTFGVNTWVVTEIESHDIDSRYGFYRIRVQRNSTDHFKVYLNGTSVIDTVAIVPDETFNYFGFLGDEGCAIDNIVVSEFTPITTTTPPTTTTEPTEPTEPPPPPADIPMEFLAIGGAIVVFIIVLVVWKLRAK